MIHVFCLVVTLLFDKSSETGLPELLRVELWTEEQRTQFKELNKDQRLYVNAMLLQKWPSTRVNESAFTAFPGGITVKQVVSDDAFIGEYVAGELVWIHGVGTTSLTDSSVANTDSFVFLSDGNERYTTVIGGVKTIAKAKAVPVTQANELIQSILGERGYRLFRMNRVDQRPWMICHVTSVSKTTASVKAFDEKRILKFQAEDFSQEAQEWLADKNNLSAMKAAKRAFDASRRANKATEESK